MPLRRLISTFVFFALSLLSNNAHADSFVYLVANHYTGFQVDGAITTDTNSGVLSYSDITDFNFLITTAAGSDTLTSANTDNNGLYGNGLTATADGLFFDFDQPFALLFFQNSAAGTYLCFQTQGCDTSGQSLELVSVANGTAVTEGQTGNVQIATMEPMATTPEPSAFVLFATGLTATFGLARFRNLAA